MMLVNLIVDWRNLRNSKMSLLLLQWVYKIFVTILLRFCMKFPTQTKAVSLSGPGPCMFKRRYNINLLLKLCSNLFYGSTKISSLRIVFNLLFSFRAVQWISIIISVSEWNSHNNNCMSIIPYQCEERRHIIKHTNS